MNIQYWFDFIVMTIGFTFLLYYATTVNYLMASIIGALFIGWMYAEHKRQKTDVTE